MADDRKRLVSLDLYTCRSFFFLHDPLRLSSSRLTSNKHHRRTNKNKRTRETRNGKIEPNVDRLRLPSVRKDATTKKESEKEKKCYKRKRKGAVRKGKKKKKKKKNSRFRPVRRWLLACD